MKKMLLLLSVIGSMNAGLLMAANATNGLALAISAKVAAMTPQERLKLSSLSQIGDDRPIYAGKLLVRVFQRGFAVALDGKAGVTVETHTLSDTNPHQGINGKLFKRVFIRAGGEKVFGAPMEGPIQLFGDLYRVHVCRKGLFFVKPDRKEDKVTDPQSIVLEQPFH